jgi:uncharacterized protein YhbP (UPF0306 family)/quercetin dioxygenase-like cupin family protein
MKKIIRKTLEETYLMSLATNTSDGIWVSDLIHIPEEKNDALYWISHPETRHSKAIAENQEVAATITLSVDPRDKKVGIQMQGFSHEYEGDAESVLRRHWKKQGLPEPEETSEELLEEEKWYVMFPYFIEVFNEEVGEKQRVDILDKKQIAEYKKTLEKDGFPVTYLWYHPPGFTYPLHKHLKPVSFFVLFGSVTAISQDGTTHTVHAGERYTEKVGTIHRAEVGGEGCVYVVGQIDEEEVSVNVE